MSSKKVIIQYNGEELSLEIEINEDNVYRTFLDIFRQKFREEDFNKKYNLTAINTSIPYLIIDENNISNIFKEKIENDAPLKILITKEEDEDVVRKDSNEKKLVGGFIKGRSDDEDDFNDNDFELLEENSNNIENNKNKITNDDENEINEGNEEKEKELNKLIEDSLNNNNFKINENIIELNNEKNNLKQEKNETDIESNLLLSNLESISKNSIKDISKNINEDVPTLPVIPLNIKKDITYKSKSINIKKYLIFFSVLNY